MMHRYYNNGLAGNRYCDGYGIFTNGWGILIAIGILIVIVILVYINIRNNNKKHTVSEAMERLKLQYVQGEITEEEYLRRKSVIDK